MDEAIKEKLSDLFNLSPKAGLVYFFGSRVKNDAGPMSDYDFAVYLNEPDSGKRAAIGISLATAIMGILKTDRVDLHILNDLHAPELKYQIIAEGKLIFEREPFAVIVEPRILTEYFDFKYLLRKYNLTKA